MRPTEPPQNQHETDSIANSTAIKARGIKALGLARILPALRVLNPLRASTWGQKGLRMLLLAILLIVVYQMYLFLSVAYYSLFNPASSAVMRAQESLLAEQEQVRSQAKLKAQKSSGVATKNQQQAKSSSQDTKHTPLIRYSWVDYEHISDTVKRAIIASEDSNFLQHSGVEWRAIWDAYEYNQRQEVRGKSRRRGGSTISQQLAKNLFLSHNRSYIRKGQELIITYMLEGLMSKQRILELYLNIAQFGPDVFGVEQASQTYFKKPASRLSAMEAAKLAALLPNPTRYSQQINGQFINARASTIRQRMRLVTPP